MAIQASNLAPRSSTGSMTVGQGDKNQLINRILSGGFNSLNGNEKLSAQQLMSPSEYQEYVLGGSKSTATQAAPAAAPATGSTPGGNIDANSLLDMYQKGLGAGGKEGTSTEDQLRLMREANALDIGRKKQEQDMQLEGQEQVLDQTQKARAKERETEFQLQRRQQTTERGNAMAAYKGL
jgi:hypothetical protein